VWANPLAERGITLQTGADRCSSAVFIATDNVPNVSYPYGSCVLLDNFALGGQMRHLSLVGCRLHSVCTNPERAKGLPRVGRMAPGGPADLNLLTARIRFGLLTAPGAAEPGESQWQRFGGGIFTD